MVRSVDPVSRHRDACEAKPMVRRIAAALVVLTLAASAWMMFVVVAMRTKSPAMLTAVRRFNRAFTNKLQLRSAGAPGAYASVIRHRGRRSQRDYETPVVPFAVDGAFLVVLPYGPSADWVQNVLAAGSAEIVMAGTTYAVDRPELITTESVRHLFPRGEQRTHRLFGVEHCLRLHGDPTNV
jgi:deazaflavin-dependent oxidoreductase (nitroreductase family)